MAKKLVFILFIFLFFTFLKREVFALSAITVINVPSEITIGQTFNVNGEISGVQTGQVYFVKCRIGPSSSNLTEGQTYNVNTDFWLTDGSAWIEMPTTENANFSLQCKIKSGVEPGNKIVFLRACLKQADGSCGSSFQSASGVNLTALTEPLPTPTPSPTPSPTPTSTPPLTPKPPTPTPKPTATYKINEVKDEDGEILSSVKVYVDEIYIHHYAPEVLTFCDGCQYDSYVNCSFGQHAIKLEKTGYEDWSKEITINPNTSDEVSPVMIFSEPNPTSTPTVLIKPTPTPSQKISPTPTPKKSNQTATDSGEVLGEEVASFSAFYPYEATDEAEKNEATPSARNKILPKIFLVGGLLLLFVSASWLWYNFVRN